MAFTLIINSGTPLDAEANGIQIHSRTLANQAADAVTISVLRRASQPFLFTARDDVRILRDGQPWFRGTALSPRKHVSNGGPGVHLHVIQGPWYLLMNSMFRLEAPASSPPPLPGYNTACPYPCVSTVAWLMVQVYCQAFVPRVVVPVWPATILPDLAYDDYPTISGAVTDSMRILLRNYLHGAIRFDYSQDIPVMQLTNRGSDLRTLAIENAGIDDIDLCLKTDTWPDGIEMRTEVAADGSPSTGALKCSTSIFPANVPNSLYPRTITPGAPFNLTVLTSAYGVQNAGPATWIPSTPQFLYNYLRPQNWEGGFSISDQGCRTGLQPGATINFSGLTNAHDPAWATMQAVVQTVTEDLLSGKTTVTLGRSGSPDAETAEQLFKNWAGVRLWRKYANLPQPQSSQ